MRGPRATVTRSTWQGTARAAQNLAQNRDHAPMMVTLKKALTEALRQLREQSIDALLEAREDKILAYGKYKEIPAP